MSQVNEIESSGHEGHQSQVEGEILAFPATMAQQAFYFFDQMESGNPAFNVAVRFHLAGPLDVPLLERAFNEIIRRHEILRTQFEGSGGELMQLVLPYVELKLGVMDISHLNESERKDETERLGTSEARKRFRLNAAPLIRGSLVRIGPDEHMLQVTVHHAVSDGWSIGLITDELAAIYEAFYNGGSSPLPPLPIQFADFTIWQNEYLKGKEIKDQLGFWKRRLAGIEELNLPTDRPRPPVKTWRGDIVSVLLPTELTARLQRIGQQNGATLFMVLLSAFKILLMRISGQTDIAVGSPIVGRNRIEVENLIGVFINTVIIRTDLTGKSSFEEVLQAVGETVLDALANQEVPFEMAVKEIAPARNLSMNPLFQVNFIHQRDFIKPVTFAGVTLTAIPSRSPGAIFDLNFFMVERDGVWRASCDFNTDIFDRETAIRMLANFRQLLISVAADPKAPVELLEILPPEERKQLLVDWNNTSRDVPSGKTVHALVEDQVRIHPNRVAVRSGDESLSYAELDKAAIRLAAHLQQLGAKPGVLIGLCVERSIRMVVGVLGILKSGAAYVPMDPSFPAERLGYMIEDAEMPIIVSQESLLGQLPPHSSQVVLIEGEFADPPNGFSSSSAAAGDLAYVIFTSGSTGRPKGVQIPHSAMVNFLASMRREPGLTPEDVLLSVTTLSFDIAGLELFLPLTSGASVVVAKKQTTSDAQLLAIELDRTHATIMQATPVTWRMLLESGWRGNRKLKALIGGEAVPRELVNALSAKCGSLWNMYGPTETTVWSTVGKLEAGEGSISIGRPIDNTQVYVVSPVLQPQPVGVPGELLIGGKGLAVGYLDRDDLTAEKFISDPFSDRPEERLYRTGDLARWRSDGTLECLGRLDHQVKIRGFRIELGEIERQLSGHPAVQECVVIARQESADEKRLTACIVYNTASIPPPSELRDYLRSKLPEYMLPAAFISLDALPLTPNGKIDRKALHAIGVGSDVSPHKSPIAPRNQTEQSLSLIFSEVLNAQIASVNDSFFDLGGHSLLAVKLMNRIQQEFGVRLPLATLFNAGSIEQLAAILTAETQPQSNWDSLVHIGGNGEGPALFLVHGAGGNVLLYRALADQLAPGVSVYGFQSQGLDGKNAILTTVKEMADHYVSELLRFRPDGPYYLGGYCMGGVVAYEMARILQARGKDIGMVALLDTYNLHAVREFRAMVSQWDFARQKIVFHFANLRQLNRKELTSYFGEKLRLIFELVNQTVAGGFKRIFGKRSAPSGTASNWETLQSVNHHAGWSHKPGAYTGHTLLFKPKENYDFYPDPQMGWGECVKGDLEIVNLSGSPHSMLTGPFARELASELVKRIPT